MSHDLFFNVLPYVIWALERIGKQITLKKHKKELLEILQMPLDRVKESWDSFFCNYSLCLGANFVSIFSEPSEPEMKAREFFNKFKESYDQFLIDFKKFT